VAVVKLQVSFLVSFVMTFGEQSEISHVEGVHDFGSYLDYIFGNEVEAKSFAQMQGWQVSSGASNSGFP
jgi:hypothetical protein